MILQYLDTAIGFAVVMLLFSLVITVLVQAVVAVLGMRGSNLRWGVTRLLQHLSPELGSEAKEVADIVLRHPAVAHTGWPKSRKATAIGRDELVALLKDIVSEADSSLEEPLKQRLARSVSLVQDNLATWFDTFMNRTTERFVLQTRWWTAGAAIVLAVGLHIDALGILHQLTADAALRSQLVAVSEATLRQAEGTFALRVEDRALASGAIQAVADDFADRLDLAAIQTAPGNLRTRQEGETWLRQQLAGIPVADTVLAAYHNRFDEATRTWLGQLGTSVAEINRSMEEATLDLIPESFPDLGRYRREPMHLIGVLMSVALLSLGAPFWYNALRRVANLRPIIAGKVEGPQTPTATETRT